jgi:hypothetical protein
VSISQNHSAFKGIVKQSYQLNLEGKPGNPCPMMQRHLAATSILPCGLFTDLLGMSLRRMDDFMTKLFIYL